MREHLTEVFASLFEWEKGSYDIGREMLGEDEIIRLSSRMPALVAEAVRRKYDLSRLTTIWARRVPYLVHHPTRALYRSIPLNLIAENDRS